MDQDETRAGLSPEQQNDPRDALPEGASDWAALTDEELFVLARKASPPTGTAGKVESELTVRLIRALSAARESSDRASGRLYRLTWLLIVLTVVIAAFTVVAAVAAHRVHSRDRPVHHHGRRHKRGQRGAFPSPFQERVESPSAATPRTRRPAVSSGLPRAL